MMPSQCSFEATNEESIMKEKSVGRSCEGVTAQVPELGRCLVIEGKSKTVLKQKKKPLPYLFGLFLGDPSYYI